MKKILIVDDDTCTRLSMRRLLSEYDVLEAENGEMAIIISQEWQPDLVLLDQMMPHMSGLEVLERIRQLNPLTQFVIVTAQGTVQLAIQTLKKGALDFIVKPFEAYVLLHTVERAFDHIDLIKEKKIVEQEKEELLQELYKFKHDLETVMETRTKECNQGKETIEKLRKAKSTFLAYLSHELRGPVQQVLDTSSSGLERYESTNKEQLKEYFSGIKASGQHLLALMEDLLNLSKLEENKVDYRLESSDINEVLDRALGELKVLCQEGNVRVERQGDQILGRILMDKSKIIQALLNLLSNSIKFSDKERVIFVSLEDHKENVGIVIKDKGVAIPENEIEHFFDPFIYSSPDPARKKGTGLSLFIASKIILDHKGKIWVENNKDGGVTYNIRLPKQSSIL